LTMENIRDWLENRLPFSDMCTSQLADTSKQDRSSRERPRREGVGKRSAGIGQS
jgi:hypothetical protein